jgi:hypothetical protein
VASLPQPWRLALEALVAVTAREGQPWSCPDARVTLVPPSDRGPALLEVEDGSGARRRAVASPDDVVSLGEAMLARVIVLEVTPNPLVTDMDRDGAGRPPANPPPPASSMAPFRPRPPWARDPAGQPATSDLLVDVLAGAYFTGPTRAVLSGPELRAALVQGRWLGALIARYDSAIAFLQHVPDQFSLASITVGIAGGYRLLTAPIELTASIEPTLGVVLMGGQPPGQPEPDVDARVDMRLGARLSAAMPITRRLRAVCAIGGDGTPAALFTDRHSHRPELPSLPGYLVGLSIGIEVAAIR